MSFTCQNPTCAIAISKAAFPVSMNCPVCQQPLVELKVAPLLSEEDEKLIASLPYVIAYPFKQTLLEKHAWTKINLFKDTFLNYLKYLGLFSASEFFNSHIKDRGMVSLFHQNLTETAFGKWNHYIRETLKFLKEKNHQFFCPELISYYEQVESGKKVKQYKGEIEYIDANGDVQLKKQETSAIGMLINFRNRYLGHGLTLDADASEKLWAEYFPIFRSLLEQMRFSNDYPMLKKEEGQTWLLQSADIVATENKGITDDNIWMQNAVGKYLSILPFFIVPGELAILSSEKPKLFTYESYTGKTIKFFSPEGIEKQTSGKILDRLNLLLRDKQKEIPFTPETFTKEIFLKRIEEENKLLLDTLISEKKIIPGVYQHRENMEIKLREWIGARANIFFIAAEAGSGKTNLLAEIQKQYTERGYPGLLIRAGRMEKNTLKEQVAYLLNIDVNEGLDKYTAIVGTQAEPSFILIDGLNEANNAEAIWQEIMDWSKIIEPGSIKFVVTSRANTKADLDRYKTEETDLNFLYGENKDHEKGLGAYAFWLTPLDMNEMKGAWENYVAKDKSRYKPLFSFDDIATFDRAIYNQINNPLVLRLFLEIYNGKNLPKKGGKHLHIWKDWFNTFSQEVQTFLKLLADEVWMKGENELLLDDLLNNEKLKQYLTSDLVNSPYARMKNMGWVSRYVKDMNGCLGFTVEGALLYLLGVKLQEQEPKIELSYIQNILSSGTKLQQSAIESFLCEQALAGDLDLVTTLIDAGSEKLDLCIRPLLYYLKAFGVEATINNILENPTENDWIAMLELDKKMLELQLQAMRKSFLIELKTKNYLNDKNAILLGVRSIIILEKDDAVFYYNKIINTINLNEDNLSVIRELAIVEKRFSNYRESIEKFERYINIFKKKNGEVNLDIAHTYNDIGITYIPLGEYKKALFFFEKSLALYLSIQGEFNNDTASVYGNIGWTYYKRKEYDKALFYYEKGKEICIKTVGHNHKLFSFFINNIGLVLDNSGEFKKAIENYEIALSINLKLLNNGDPDIAANLTNIGISWDKIGDFKKAIEYKEKGLEIVLNFYGENHPALSNNYNNLGVTYCNMGDYKKALFFYEKSLDIRIRSFGENHPDLDFNYFNIASTWYTLKNYPKAMFYYNKCLVIRIDCFGEHHPLVAETYNYLADVHCDIGEYFKAIEMYNKSLDIFHKNPNSGYLDHSTYYFNIGFCLQNIEKFQQAIEAFSNGFEIQKKGGFLFRIAQCYESLGNLNDALRYYIESAEIRKEDPECGLENESTIGSIKNTKRLAKELGKEIELPEWIKN